MLKDFNLLVTTWRGNESRARSELKYLLEKGGDSAPVIDRTGISGLIAAKTSLDPFVLIGSLREILHERPYEFRHSLRIIPIEAVVHTGIDEIKQAIVQLSSKIQADETFRITVEKRFTSLSTSEVIEAAAAGIKRKVNLDKPDKVVLIEVVGGLTGISVIRPDETISVLKEKVL